MSIEAFDRGHRAASSSVSLPLAQRALHRRVEAVQADAERRGRVVVARQQVVLERLHERPISAGSSPAIAAATTEATGVSDTPSPSAGRRTIIASEMRLIMSA